MTTSSHFYTAPSSWTRSLSRHTLERIYTQTTDREAQREITAECNRRDDEAYDREQTVGGSS